MSLIRKWLNLEKEAETRGQILSPLPSFPLLAVLAAQRLQRSQEADVSETDPWGVSHQGFLQHNPPTQGALAAARGGRWAGRPERLLFCGASQIAQS